MSFQFLNGAIKITKNDAEINIPYSFQFLNGAIKILKKKGILFLCDFNSLMVRLK